MSNRRKPTDPRRAGGDIAGPGGPHDRDEVVLDSTNAILMDYVEVATVALGRFTEGGVDSQMALAMLIGGRINKTKERSRILYFFDTDGAAAIISELMALATRHSETFARELSARVVKLLEEGTMRFPDGGVDDAPPTSGG